MRHVAFEGGDVVQALGPDALRDQMRIEPLALEDFLVHAHDQHLLVVGAVEDPDAAPLGHRLHVAPEVVVVELFGRRLLERIDLASLRVHARHHMLDRAVLTGRIHRLEH